MLFKALKNDGHSHIVYLKNQEEVEVSKAKGHSHNVSFTSLPPEILQENVDPQTGMIPPEVLLSQYRIEENEGHTHELGFIPQDVPKEDKDNIKDIDLVKKNRDLWVQAGDQEGWSLDQAAYSEAFYMGEKHWDSEDVAKLKRQKRACLVINETKTNIDLLSGYQRQNRTDIQAFPVETGDSRAADIFTILIKNIWKNNNAEYKESEIFWDQLKVGRGNWLVDVDVSKTIRGEIKLGHGLWDEVLYGPHNEPDASDAEFMVRTKKMSKGKVIAMWPDKAKDIEADFEFREQVDSNPSLIRDRYIQEGQPASTGLFSKLGGFFGLGTSEAFDVVDPEVVDVARKMYRIIQVERKIYHTKTVVFNQEDRLFVDVTNIRVKSDIDGILALNGFQKLNLSDFHIQKTVIAGTVVLENTPQKLPFFSAIPAYGNKLRGKWWGKIADVIDIQKLINKSASMSVDIVNKMASYGFGYSAKAFRNPKDEDHFKRNHATPGFLQKFAEGFKDKIYEFQGIRVPSEVFANQENASNKLKVIMSVNPEILGQDTGGLSGVAILRKQRAALVGNEFYFDRLSLAKRLVARRIIEIIQLIMTPEDILRVVENQNQQGTVDIGGRGLYPEVEVPQSAIQLLEQAVERQIITQVEAEHQLEQFKQQLQQEANAARRAELLEILNTPDLLKMDISIGEGQESPTTQVAQFAMVSELAKQGVPIPPDELIMMTPGLQVQNKQRITAKMAAAAQAQAQEEFAKNQTEVLKTQIAAASKQQPQPMGSMLQTR